MNIHRSMCIHTCTYVSIHTGGGKGECEYKRMGHVGGQELAALLQVCCSMLQCVVVCCMCGSTHVYLLPVLLQCVAVCCSVPQRFAVCCSLLQCDAVCCILWQRVVACCGVLQCVTACCSVL